MLATLAPQIVTFVMSAPAPRFVPEMTTSTPPVTDPVDGSTPMEDTVLEPYLATYHVLLLVPSSLKVVLNIPPAYTAPSTGSAASASTVSLAPFVSAPPSGCHRAPSNQAIRLTRTLAAFVSTPSESYVFVNDPPA